MADKASLDGSNAVPLSDPNRDEQWERPDLSRREVEVMLAWLLTDSKAEVCGRLYLAPGTVNTHLSRIRAKYAAVGRAAPTKAMLLARALQDGLIRIDEI